MFYTPKPPEQDTENRNQEFKEIPPGHTGTRRLGKRSRLSQHHGPLTERMEYHRTMNHREVPCFCLQLVLVG